MNKRKLAVLIAVSAVVLIAFISGFKNRDFLDTVENDTFNYFWELTDDANGLVPDSSRSGSPCSIAAVGFGLTAYCIGAENGWVSREGAYNRVLTALRAFYYDIEHKEGFFYHFMDMRTGKRVWDCEISSIDTALFIAGALTAGEYFKDTEVEKLANKIYARVNWKWMLNGKKVLCMGWKPSGGFLPYYWATYNELMILYALAIGAPENAVSPGCWREWKRPRTKYKGKDFIYCRTGSLFVYQYSHAWIDFRDINDRGINYFENSKIATIVNREFCIDREGEFFTYGEYSWGLTACIGPDGYRGYGGGPNNTLNDGTVSPCAAGGSIPFLPEECIETLREMKENNSRIYTRYGFIDAFNLNRNWYANEHLGINQGIILIMIENYKSGMVWNYFMRHPAIQKWKKLCFDDGASKQ